MDNWPPCLCEAPVVDHVGQGSFQWSSVTAHPQPATAGWVFKVCLESHGSKCFRWSNSIWNRLSPHLSDVGIERTQLLQLSETDDPAFDFASTSCGIWLDLWSCDSKQDLNLSLKLFFSVLHTATGIFQVCVLIPHLNDDCALPLPLTASLLACLLCGHLE